MSDAPTPSAEAGQLTPRSNSKALVSLDFDLEPLLVGGGGGAIFALLCAVASWFGVSSLVVIHRAGAQVLLWALLPVVPLLWVGSRLSCGDDGRRRPGRAAVVAVAGLLGAAAGFLGATVQAGGAAYAGLALAVPFAAVAVAAHAGAFLGWGLGRRAARGRAPAFFHAARLAGSLGAAAYGLGVLAVGNLTGLAGLSSLAALGLATSVPVAALAALGARRNEEGAQGAWQLGFAAPAAFAAALALAVTGLAGAGVGHHLGEAAVWTGRGFELVASYAVAGWLAAISCAHLAAAALGQRLASGLGRGHAAALPAGGEDSRGQVGGQAALALPGGPPGDQAEEGTSGDDPGSV